MQGLAHHRAQSTNSLWRDRPAGETGFGACHRRGEVPAPSATMATIWPTSGASAPVCTLVAGESRWSRWNPHRSDRGESQEVPAAARTAPSEVRRRCRRGVEVETVFRMSRPDEHQSCSSPIRDRSERRSRERGVVARRLETVNPVVARLQT